MKALSVASLAIISIGLSIHLTSSCSENNKHIGPIDTLMLKRSIEEKGYLTIAQQIENHQFEKSFVLEKNHPRNVIQYYPFLITHFIAKHDGSELSNTIFHRLYRTEVQEVAIRLNNEAAQMDRNSIDECTTWDSGNVKATARFHNKAALVAALNKLKS